MQEVAGRPEGKTTKQTCIIITIKRVNKGGEKGSDSDSVRHTHTQTHTDTQTETHEHNERFVKGVRKKKKETEGGEEVHRTKTKNKISSASAGIN